MKTLYVSLFAVASLSALPSMVGCGSQTEQPPVAQPTATADDHGHPHPHSDPSHGHGAGPHDGTLADWGGGKYHVEFTVDHDRQEGTVYILGSDEISPAPITAEEIQLSIKDPLMQVTLKASPQEGDPEGSASRFIGNHASLGVVQEYEGTIIGVIDDTPYSGTFKEEPHSHDE